MLDVRTKKWLLDHLGQSLCKKDSPSVFKAAFQRAATLTNAVSGFQKCGLYPFTKKNDQTKLGPSKIFEKMQAECNQFLAKQTKHNIIHTTNDISRKREANRQKPSSCKWSKYNKRQAIGDISRKREANRQ